MLWAQAETSTNLSTSSLLLAHQLHLPLGNEEDQHVVMSAVKHWLETHNNWLLILDNADNLAIIDDFLPQTSSGHILITTRERSTGHVAQPLKVEKMSIEEAMLLLLRRSARLRPDAVLTSIPEAERTVASDIVDE